MSVEVGQLLDDRYEIKRLIGKGGMGNVYEGENIAIRRQVAIKVLKTDAAMDPSIVRRFEREAQAAGRIGSEHIVEVLDLGKLPTGERYMVMEFLQGETLGDRMKRAGKMAPEDILPILIGLLEGLGDAHFAGILHRDLKPANVWLASDRQQEDFVKIVDFGVSKFIELASDDPTATGVTLGTPRYMAPEQAKGEKDVDYRADLYSVGVILFRALSARPPFLADTYNELMFKVVLEDPPSLSTVVENADPTLVRIVAKALEREREKRFQSADAMADALRGWLEGHGHVVPVRPSTRRRRLDSSSSFLEVPEFPGDDSSTHHATALSFKTPARKRKPVLIAAAAILTVVVALTTARVLQLVMRESTPATAASDAPESDAPESDVEPQPKAPRPEAPPAPVPTTVASPTVTPSASASATPSNAPQPPSMRFPSRVPRPEPPSSGPSRKYRRKL